MLHLPILLVWNFLKIITNDRLMKTLCQFLTRAVTTFVVAALCSTAQAVMQPAELIIKEVYGTASYSVGGEWKPLTDGMKLAAGAILKTEADSTIDLLLPSSATALRLTAGSQLRIDRLNKESTADTAISETSLTLVAGSLAGTQRKLPSKSRFQINIPNGVVQIVGTKYLVRADGTVFVLEGEVSIQYNLPDGGGTVEATITAGYSFDPATGQVVPILPADLQNIIADINTTKDTANVFSFSGGASLVVKPKEVVSPP
jgi:hypothetical protein